MILCEVEVALEIVRKSVKARSCRTDMHGTVIVHLGQIQTKYRDLQWNAGIF